MYLGLHFQYLGASSVGCLALTVLSSFAWERGFPRPFSKGEQLFKEETHENTEPKKPAYSG